jgi:hypothetical protein
MYPAHVPISPLDTPIIPNTLSDIRALFVLNLAENNLGELVLPEGWTEDYDSDEDEEVYKHTDGTKQKDNPSKSEGIIAIANAIQNMRAISSVNLIKNGIGIDQAQALTHMLKGHPTLKSLCGNTGDETELNMSGKMSGAEDAILLAAEVVDNGALSVLNLAENNLGELALPGGWAEDYDSEEEVYKHTDGREQKDNPGRPAGIIAIASAIPDMRALTKLDVRQNDIHGAKAGKVFADMLPPGSSEHCAERARFIKSSMDDP